MEVRHFILAILLCLAACSSQEPAQPTPATSTPESVSGSAEYLQTARSHYEAGEFEEAITFARLSLDLAQAEGSRDASGPAGLLLAQAYEKQGDSDKALEAYLALKSSQLDDESRASVETTLAGYGEQAQTGVKRAESLYDQGKYAEALPEAETALSLLEAGLGDQTQLGTAKGLVGRCHLKLGDSARAREYLQEAVAQAPADAQLKADLARAQPASAPRRRPQAAQSDQALPGAPDLTRAKDYARSRLRGQSDVPIPNAPVGTTPIAPVTW